MNPADRALSFERLVTAIGHAHAELAAQASRAINASLSLRNWLIGFHIEVYERHGVDRQQYGEKLLDRLAVSLEKSGVSRCDRRELYRYRQFYLAYPQIQAALPPQLASTLEGAVLVQTDRGQIVETVSPQSQVDGQTLLARLSFSHFTELTAIEGAAKRA